MPVKVSKKAVTRSDEGTGRLTTTIGQQALDASANAARGNRTGAPMRMGRMKNITIEDLSKTLAAMKVGTHDAEVRGRGLIFHENGMLSLRDEPEKLYSWSEWGFTQFCTKLKVPTEFIRKCPDGNGPASQWAIVNHWLNNASGSHLMLRLKDSKEVDEKTGAAGIVRAVLTDRYSPFDNPELLELITPMVEKNGCTLKVGQVTDKSFHLRAIFPEKVEINGDDTHQVGVHIRNSEVGAGNLSGDYLVYRQVCTNGLIALVDGDHLFMQRHKNVQTHELRARVRDAFGMVQERRSEVLDMVERSASIEVAKPMAEIKRVLKQGKANDDFVEMAIEAYDEEPIATRFGVGQAITRAAQKVGMDQRVLMEEIAGRLLVAA